MMWSGSSVAVAHLMVIGTILCGNVVGASVTETPPQHVPTEALPHYPRPKYDGDGNIRWFPRIVGGQPAYRGEFLAKVSLQTRDAHHFCGGILVGMDAVMTAAHCVTDSTGRVVDPASLQAMGDDLTITQPGSLDRQTRYVTHIEMHHNYSVFTLENDIAIMRVWPPFVMTATFAPLPRARRRPDPGQNCTLAGWGATTDGGNASATLQRVDLTIKSMRQCNTSYDGFVAPGMFCAGSHAAAAATGSHDACQGDSGGALVCQLYIAGIVSFGKGCGDPQFPGVYVDVSFYRDWIESTLMALALVEHERHTDDLDLSRNGAAPQLRAHSDLVWLLVVLIAPAANQLRERAV